MNYTRRHHGSAWVCFLRSTLFFTNSVLGSVGLIILGYSLLAYLVFRKAIHDSGVIIRDDTPYPWFILATAATGAVTFLTASVGLIAGCIVSAYYLNLYSFMLIVMLGGQGALIIAWVVDGDWKTWPPDPSGEYERLRKWIEANEELSQNLAIGLLGFQLFAVAVSCALSAANQQLEEDASSDDDDEYWQPTKPLLSPARSTASLSPIQDEGPSEQGDLRGAAWKKRMREKYGLDMTKFTYDPEEQRIAALTMGTSPARDRQGSVVCTIM